MKSQDYINGGQQVWMVFHGVTWDDRGQVEIIEAPRGTNAAQTEWRQHVAACCQRIATASNGAAEMIGGMAAKMCFWMIGLFLQRGIHPYGFNLNVQQ